VAAAVARPAVDPICVQPSTADAVRHQPGQEVAAQLTLVGGSGRAYGLHRGLGRNLRRPEGHRRTPRNRRSGQHKRVARVMREAGLSGLRLRRRHRTAVADPAAVKAPDLLGRDFTARTLNTRYVGDITYLPIADGNFCCCSTRRRLDRAAVIAASIVRAT
jgi:transposase InsO family protein